MILYNVTVNIEEAVHDEWLQWMLNSHIPQVLNTGMFRSYRMFKILSRQEGETGTTYSIQYFAETLTDYEIYRDVYAPALQKDTQERYGSKMMIFRTLLEEV